MAGITVESKMPRTMFDDLKDAWEKHQQIPNASWSDESWIEDEEDYDLEEQE